MDAFSFPQFRDDEAARKFLESVLWPDGPVCPHCGVVGHAYATKRPGVFRCAEKECRKDFTVTMKTVMERSHIALHKWVQAFALMTASKKGVSAHQLHRTLDIHYQSAWFMAHRIRECMRSGGLGPLGGEGKIVEADETYHGKTEQPRVSPQRRGRPYNPRGSRGPKDKRPIVALVERGGNVRTFHVPVADQTKSRRSSRTTSRTSCDCIRTKAGSISMLPTPSPRMKPCIIRLASTSDMKMAALSIPIQQKVTSRFSSGACVASTSIAKRNTCIVIWPSSISGTIIASS